ncbi:MAG: YciI family protein [Steroidobacteraceae bacterium]
MRVMVIVKANKDSESGVLPSEALLTEMGKFNEELVRAGVLLAAEGLHASSSGVRVKFGGSGKSIVTDGPFTESKELIAGFWLWQVKSVAEAVEWIRRSPVSKGNEEVEIRRVFEAEDFGGNATHELQAQEANMRERLLRKQTLIGQ